MVEVCAVTSATPAPGQTVSAQISTEDGTANGKNQFIVKGLAVT